LDNDGSYLISWLRIRTRDLFYVSFYNTVSISNYITLNCGMTDEELIEKDMKGSGHGVIEVLSQYLMEDLSKITEYLNQDSQSSDRDLNYTKSRESR
jgi:hypothetical protein